MKTECKCYILDKNVLTDDEYELLYGIVSSVEPDYPFLIRMKDIHDYFYEVCEINGKELTNGEGKIVKMNYEKEIKFLSGLLDDSQDFEYIIVEI